MQKRVFISRNYRSQYDAAGKAKIDCENILSNNGYKNIGLKQTSLTNPILGTSISFLGTTWALLRLKRKSTLVLQYPTKKFYTYMLSTARMKGCKIKTIVHDLHGLKNIETPNNTEIALLKKSDALIVHNPKMKAWLEEKGMTMPISTLNIFDYLKEKDTPKRSEPKNNNSGHTIVYAGGLGKRKNAFLYDLPKVKHDNFNVNLYGIGFNPEELPTNQKLIDYKGFFPSTEIADRLSGTFGLVWDGYSLDTCSGKLGQYLMFNNPHKCSLYMQAELPIIIWEHAAISDFIVEQKIGLKLDSLENLDSLLKSITAEQYAELKKNVAAMKEKISNGHHLTESLKEVDALIS